MEAIAEKLENKLHEWKPETSQKVRALVAEIIEQADDDALDIGRSRSVEQEVMDILDEPSYIHHHLQLQGAKSGFVCHRLFLLVSIHLFP